MIYTSLLPDDNISPHTPWPPLLGKRKKGGGRASVRIVPSMQHHPQLQSNNERVTC